MAATKTTAEIWTFKIPLGLVTPHTRGDKVLTAQKLLSGHNRFSGSKSPVAPYVGKLDSEWGPACAAATARCKFLLGYPDNRIDSSFGSEIAAYLRDKTLPPSYQKTRLQRLAATPKQEAFDVAVTQLGITENPAGSNLQKYGQWYKMNGEPWCAMFVSWCYKDFIPSLHYSYVPNIWNDARQGLNHLSITFTPQRGDLATFNWEGPNCHVAFFDEWIDSHNFHDLGGNTGSTNFSNGGEVLRSKRNISEVTNFIRVW